MLENTERGSVTRLLTLFIITLPEAPRNIDHWLKRYAKCCDFAKIFAKNVCPSMIKIEKN